MSTSNYVMYAELPESEQARLENEAADYEADMADRENDERRIERIAARRTLPMGTNDANRGAW